jgi:hypothetical protein
VAPSKVTQSRLVTYATTTTTTASTTTTTASTTITTASTTTTTASTMVTSSTTSSEQPYSTTGINFKKLTAKEFS